MNYRESLLTLTTTDGDTVTVSAYKVKLLRGNARSSTLTIEPVDGQVIRIEVARPEPDVRAELYAALAAGE